MVVSRPTAWPARSDLPPSRRFAASSSGSEGRGDTGARRKGVSARGQQATRRAAFDVAELLRGKLQRMAPPLIVSIPHQLGRAEARRRIETGFAKIAQLLPGSAGACSER